MHTIWIIDNSLVVRKIVETSLGRAGYQVRSFADGVEALRELTTLQRSPRATFPKVIILELKLPRMDGYDVLQKLKQHACLEHTRILILSVRDGILDRLKGRIAGATAYMTKPFRTQELASVIAELLLRSAPLSVGQ